jgi:hypothetical protein
MSENNGKYILLEFDEEGGRKVAIVPNKWVKRCSGNKMAV